MSKLYCLNADKNNPNILEPKSYPYRDASFIKNTSELYLSEQLTSDQHGHLHHAYRLHAKKPHTVEMALQYDIKCPRCRVRDMKLVGRCLSSRDLGLYKCRVCDQD